MAIVPRRRREERSLAERAPEPFGYLRNQINRVFDDFWDEPWLAPRHEMAAGFWPQVDVTETDKEIKVSAEIPLKTTCSLLKVRRNTSAKKRRKANIAWSAATAHFNALSNCPRKSTNRERKLSSKKVCCD